MKPLTAIGRSVLLACCFAAISIASQAASEPAIPSANEVVQKALDRVESPVRWGAQSKYQYTKHTVTEDLRLTGGIKDRKEKLYQVSVESGLSYLKLLQLNGQNLSASELKKETAREAAERQKMMDAKPGKFGDERESFLTADLIQKYNYTMVGIKQINGRDSYMINLEPKTNLVVKKMTDRFANQMAGTVWIDTQDFEIARADIRLKGEVNLWGGMIGSLKYCHYTLERTRTVDGVWFNSSSRGIFEGRKLLEPMFIRTRSDSSNFRRDDVAMR